MKANNDYEADAAGLCNMVASSIWDVLAKAGAPIYEMEFQDEDDGTWNRDEGASVICLPGDHLLVRGHDGDICVVGPDEVEETFGEGVRFCRWESKDGPPPLEPEADHLAVPEL